MTYLAAKGLELRVVPDSHNAYGRRGRQGRQERGKAQIRRLILPYYCLAAQKRMASSLPRGEAAGREGRQGGRITEGLA